MGRGWYNGFGLSVVNRNIDFLSDPKFISAYTKGVHSGHRFGKDGEQDINIEWRVFVALWAASHALSLDGDFVECGVNTGILSLAIFDYFDFEETQNGKRQFYLFDTFSGIPEEQMSEIERKKRLRDNERMYFDCWELAQRNFREFSCARLVRGRVPDTLRQTSIEKVAYLSIDLNIVEPEIKALEHFWERLASGAPVLLDDYGSRYHRDQYLAIEKFAADKGVKVLNLPTGQGLILRP